MARLRIAVPDELTLEFTCSNYERVNARALSFVRDTGKLQAKCSCDRAATLTFFPEDESDVGRQERDWRTEFPGFFFDNTDYNVYAVLSEHGFKNLRVRSRFAADEGNGKFASFERKRVRSGLLNFENDIGRFDFTLEYEDGADITRSLTFTGEVLSQKLDARKDWKTMIDDVERRYAMLAADYLRRTYHSFERTRSQSSENTPDLIWWNLYEAERTTFMKAVRTILDRPRKRLHGFVEYVRADQLKRLTPRQENLFGEHRLNAAYLYRNEYDTHSQDTPENRFVKYAIGQIGKKYAELRKLICRESQFGKRLSDSEKARMLDNEKWFSKTLANPFFRGVGRFTGLRQLSLTLQNAPGYATVFRTYAILNSSYMLFEGLRRLETKSIADLYEIWCFLKVEDIVMECCRRQFAGQFIEPESNHGELSGKFVRQLGTGSSSEVVFSVKSANGGVELARIIYNPKISEKERKNNGLTDVIYPTGLTGSKGEIPDIVLRLSRSSMNQGEKFNLTYLFDAKYRIEDAEESEANVVMRPPQDAIDQMHRYRDAIYYAEPAKVGSLVPADYKREVIGGYVLFPGVCDAGIEPPKDDEDDKRPSYLTSIDKVNIGALPLRPNNANEYRHLEDFINRLLQESPTLEAALDRLNPQHGELIGDATQEAMAEAVLHGTYAEGQLSWIEEHSLYNLPKSAAEQVGVFSMADAKRKKLLVLVRARGVADVAKVYKIEDCIREIGNDELNAPPYSYFHTATRGPYYLFKVSPLVKPMTNIATKLKIVSLEKEGVCRGVLKCAEDSGLEVVRAPTRDAALAMADGVVVFDTRSVPGTSDLRDLLVTAAARQKSHQPLAMDMRWKKARKFLVRWLRILLSEVHTRKYVLYIDGREDDGADDLSKLSAIFLADVLKMV